MYHVFASSYTCLLNPPNALLVHYLKIGRNTNSKDCFGMWGFASETLQSLRIYYHLISVAVEINLANILSEGIVWTCVTGCFKIVLVEIFT